ncbi:3-keto-5-aminohexanoate cleavage protein [Mesorhizobium caraganae]|uniref:3-keto-5-aminohexanoate cleavage protein n=1 Tax=Mesorhizobium caraganae TaxID=483206 RepID=UPI001780AD3D|nr:3-keto-5-aminohexanoate cleavage protein [Mesorhizobium caraganae]
MTDKAIITCAVTGSAHTPTMSPHLPISAKQIEDEAVAAAEAGAAVVHLHARNPDDGRASYDPALFAAFVPNIRARSDVVINISTGGSGKIEDRMAAALALKPEMASLNMGSLSPYGREQILGKFDTWKHEWEVEQFRTARHRIYPNTEDGIERIIRNVGGQGTRFECECYDVSHLYNLAYFADKGLIEPPFIIQTIFGFSGGIGLHFENVIHMQTIARHLFGEHYFWSIIAPGRHQFKYCTMASVMGGNVRVGLEDNLYLDKGVLAKSNAEQVRRMRDILSLLSIDICTPDEVRKKFKLNDMAV